MTQPSSPPPELETIVYQPEQGGPGLGRLGRHVVHDVRSRAFGVRAVMPAADVAPEPVPWWRRSVFDQNIPGERNGRAAESSCTFQSVAGMLDSSPYRLVPHVRAHAAELHDPAFRYRGYRLAQSFDPWDGEEPTYFGSSGLAACQAAKALGLVPAEWEYRWCFGMADVLDTLARLGPVSIGTNWYEGFDRPDAKGRLTPAGAIRGGHQTELVAYDDEDREVVGVNSWGKRWGVNGRFRLRLHVLERLLGEDGDAVTWVRAS